MFKKMLRASVSARFTAPAEEVNVTSAGPLSLPWKTCCRTLCSASAY